MLSCVSFKQPIAKVCPLLFNFKLLALRRSGVRVPTGQNKISRAGEDSPLGLRRISVKLSSASSLTNNVSRARAACGRICVSYVFWVHSVCLADSWLAYQLLSSARGNSFRILRRKSTLGCQSGGIEITKGIAETVEETILKQLSMGASCRVHLHRECCRTHGLQEPSFDRASDLRFDSPFDELLKDEMIRKVGDVGVYTFYEITKKGRIEIEPAIARAMKKHQEEAIALVKKNAELIGEMFQIGYDTASGSRDNDYSKELEKTVSKLLKKVRKMSVTDFDEVNQIPSDTGDYFIVGALDYTTRILLEFDLEPKKVVRLVEKAVDAYKKKHHLLFAIDSLIYSSNRLSEGRQFNLSTKLLKKAETLCSSSEHIYDSKVTGDVKQQALKLIDLSTKTVYFMANLAHARALTLSETSNEGARIESEFQYLCSLFNDKDKNGKIVALRVLGMFYHDVDTLRFLEERIKHEDSEIRCHVIEAICDIAIGSYGVRTYNAVVNRLCHEHDFLARVREDEDDREVARKVALQVAKKTMEYAKHLVSQSLNDTDAEVRACARDGQHTMNKVMRIIKKRERERSKALKEAAEERARERESTTDEPIPDRGFPPEDYGRRRSAEKAWERARESRR